MYLFLKKYRLLLYIPGNAKWIMKSYGCHNAGADAECYREAGHDGDLAARIRDAEGNEDQIERQDGFDDHSVCWKNAISRFQGVELSHVVVRLKAKRTSKRNSTHCNTQNIWSTSLCAILEAICDANNWHGR